MPPCSDYSRSGPMMPLRDKAFSSNYLVQAQHMQDQLIARLHLRTPDTTLWLL